MEGTVIIGGFLGLIYLIAFFGLVNNVSKISQKLTEHEKPDYWVGEYNKYRYLNENALAKTALQNLIWTSLTKTKSLKNYEILKAKHEADLVRLGGVFPKYPY